MRFERLRSIATPRRRGLTVVLAAVLSMGVAGCGDDDDDTEAGGADTTEAAAGGGVEEYCERIGVLETLPQPEADFESMSPEQLRDFAKNYVTEEVQPLVEDLKPHIPDEIRADANVVIAGFDEVAASGDFQALEDDQEVQAAELRIHEFDLENCGWGSSEVEGLDYAYKGVADAGAGLHSFDFENTGKEFHMLGIVRKKDGTTESWDELLALPEDQSEAKTEFIGEVSVNPGHRDYFVADLEPGEYLAVCFIPVGSTEEAHESGQEPDGPPHFTKGMKAEFTVS